MIDDAGTDKIRLSDIQNPTKQVSNEGFSRDEIDSLAELIGGSEETTPEIDLEDTGRFAR